MNVKRLMLVRRGLTTLAATLLVLTSAIATARAATGEENFNKICKACHTIGAGKLVGPDLKGVNERRSEEWLLNFVPSPQKMIGAGDPVAVQLQKEFSLVMPDPPVSRDEIKDILAYIKSGPVAAPAPIVSRAATPEDILHGQEYFQGLRHFANGGPACNSCHHVQNDAVIGGGVLAKDLTSVFGRMGQPGVQAILGKPPFPVMEEAFRDKALTDDEVFALISFLQDADKKQAFQQPRDYGFKLLYSGVIGLLVLFGLYGLFGRRRKKRLVNHEIFDRQIKTQ